MNSWWKRSKRLRKGRAIWVSIEIVLFLAGVILIVYPWWDRWMQQQKQLELLLQWDEFVRTESEVPIETMELTHHVIHHRIAPLLVEGEWMIGTIAVSKVDLFEPMFARTTEKTLKMGIGSVLPEVLPGDAGNLALAGHRSRTFGKQFNRLDELDAGDTIVLQTSHNEYVYEVHDIFLVKPDELHVLDQTPHQYELTLITCEPSRNPTHRLIVKAYLSAVTEKEGDFVLHGQAM